MNCRFGISASMPEHLMGLPAKLPEALSAVEFPGDMLESSAGCQKLSQLARNGVLLAGRDFISPEISALIPEENCKLRSELEEHFQLRCARAADLGVKDFSVAFDLFQALASPEYGRKLGRFLRRCAGVIREFDQVLRLVCRIPGGGNFGAWEELLKFRRELLCYNVELLLELHPHEPNASEAISNALKTFRIHDNWRRVCFDSNIGNTLTAAAIKRCSETYARDLEQQMVIFFYPGSFRIDSTKTAELETMVKAFTGIEEGA